MAFKENPAPVRMQKGWVHCPICTHTVGADVLLKGKQVFTKPGQKCHRCGSTLDAAYILYLDKVAA